MKTSIWILTVSIILIASVVGSILYFESLSVPSQIDPSNDPTNPANELTIDNLLALTDGQVSFNVTLNEYDSGIIEAVVINDTRYLWSDGSSENATINKDETKTWRMDVGNFSEGDIVTIVVEADPEWGGADASVVSTEGFGIYLLDSGEIVISDSDIVFYRKFSHEIGLTKEGAEKIEKLSLEVPLNGTEFLIKVYGKNIYTGWFWPPHSSIPCSGIVIETLVRDGTIKIETGYPPFHFQGEDPRGSHEVLNYFREEGKLTGCTIQVVSQLSSDIITRGDNVTLSAIVKDDTGRTIEGATVTATVGDLEILFLLREQGNSNYQVTINTSILSVGTYDIVVTAQEEGYEPGQTSLVLNVTTYVYDYYGGVSLFREGIHIVATSEDPRTLFGEYNNINDYWKMLLENETTQATDQEFISIILSRGDKTSGGYTIQIENFCCLESYPVKFLFQVNFTDPGDGVATTDALTNPLVLVPIGKLTTGEYNIEVPITQYILSIDEEGNPIYTQILTFAPLIWEQSLTINKTEDSNPLTNFEVILNGNEAPDLTVQVDLSDGLTEEEANKIVEATFIQTMGEKFHRLDTLVFDDNKITAHYTWGYSENDMGHVFDLTADLTTLKIIINHCF